ncbi:PAS domain-containing sensor histidine kinase [Pedobacter boryungensis]|uniref:histidine kinase n=1 Tax=Pedobacter boryungensis TaxID=869962 RepID=A0ABX2D844_9SPHI|nr:PAS domain-containing sensor histidine kinase [Pedobacter boryungensis]NQX30228.1 PAS domain-containing sensor histidine kinase [Pedobacter boryungensis]
MDHQINNSDFLTIAKDKYDEYLLLSNFYMISGDLLCIADFNGYFKRINPAVVKLLGYTEEELMARPINDFVYIDDKIKTNSSRETVYDGVLLNNFENRYVTKSGEIVWLAWTSMPFVEKKLVFGIAKDVTLRKREEEERNLLIANLSKINKDLQTFTQMTSHDMRSPVNNIVAISKLLDNAKIEDPKTVELINILNATSDQLHHTINNFVDVMIKNDKLSLQIEELNLAEVLHTVTTSIASLLLTANAKLETDFSAFNTIAFNRLYLESIFLNLITNAIKYANPAKPPVIKITAVCTNGLYQLIISDNGLGFDVAKVKDKIFGMYQVFHEHEDSKGLGLHLVHGHITSLGGKIEVDSRVNEGTTFTISFKALQS